MPTRDEGERRYEVPDDITPEEERAILMALDDRITKRGESALCRLRQEQPLHGRFDSVTPSVRAPDGSDDLCACGQPPVDPRMETPPERVSLPNWSRP